MSTQLTEQQVVEYLQAHPEFFQDQPELLLTMQIPHHHSGSISLVEKQLLLLREKVAQLSNQQQDLMQIARDNSQLFEKTRLLTLDLIEAGSLDEALSSVDEHFRLVFKIPCYSLILFADQPFMAGKVVSLATAKQRIGHLLNSSYAISGRLAAADLAFLFPDQPLSRIGSCAVAELAYQGSKGVLAIAHPSLHYYDSTADTLFLRYIADVFARLLPTWVLE